MVVFLIIKLARSAHAAYAGNSVVHGLERTDGSFPLCRFQKIQHHTREVNQAYQQLSASLYMHVYIQQMITTMMAIHSIPYSADT